MKLTMEYTGTHLHPDPISDSPGSVPSLLGSGWWLQLEVRTDAAAESALSLLDFDHHALQLLSRAAPFVAELQNLHCSSVCVCAFVFAELRVEGWEFSLFWNKRGSSLQISYFFRIWWWHPSNPKIGQQECWFILWLCPRNGCMEHYGTLNSLGKIVATNHSNQINQFTVTTKKKMAISHSTSWPIFQIGSNICSNMFW